MNVQFDNDELAAVVERIVHQAFDETISLIGQPNGRLGYPEAEAAALLGVMPYVLRDARLRGEVQASKVGSKIVYTPEQLRDFLSRNRWEPK